MFTKMKIALALCATLAGGVAMADGFRGGGAGGRAEILQKFDTNKDGQLDASEKAAMKQAWEAKRAERKAEMLAKFDTNKNGTIDESEKAAMKQAFEAKRAERTAEVFKKLDADGDGQLSLTEFQAGSRQDGHAPPRARSLPSWHARQGHLEALACAMLAAMATRRVPPLAIAFALIAAALVAALWVTRTTTNDAFAAARDGEALAVEQSVRADLPEGGPPDAASLDAPARGSRSGRPALHRGHRRPRPRAPRSAGTAVGAGLRGRVRCTLAGASASSCARRCGGRGRQARGRGRSCSRSIRSRRTSCCRRRRGRSRSAGSPPWCCSAWRSRWCGASSRGAPRRRSASARSGWPASARCRRCSRTRSRTRSRRSRATRSCSRRLPAARSRARRRERVVDEAIRLETLINDLLEFVRTGELHAAAVEPGGAGREATATARSRSRSRGGAAATWPLDEAAHPAGARQPASTTRSRRAAR